MPNKLVDNVKDPVLRGLGQEMQNQLGLKLTTRDLDNLSEDWVQQAVVPVAREAGESAGKVLREAAENVGRVTRANPVAVPVVLGVLGGIAVLAGAVYFWKKWGPGS